MQYRERNPEKLKRTIFNKRLWESTVAIFRYVPRALVTKKLNGQDFYKLEKIDEFRRRALEASTDKPTAWGTMNHAQIFHHLNLAFGGALGYFSLPDESYFFGRTFVKWILVDWFPEQPKGLRLPLNFAIPHAVQFDFDKEQKLFIEILEKAGNTMKASDWGPHPYFGYMSHNEWGKLAIVHIDYHLRQLSV
jgi:Protein of unknown function (DUF1569).